MKYRKHKKMNESGSAIVFVLVAFTIATILVMLVLMSSLLNIKMKSIDANTKNAFYSCESAIDEIKTGLQDQVSTAYTAAYLDVMQRYTSMSKDERKAKFDNEYLESLRSSLQETATSTKYSVDKLKGYVLKTPMKSATLAYGAEITTVSQTSGGVNTTMNLMSPIQDGLVLKNLVVKYTDEKGNFSQIRTDIVLKYPNVSFTQTSTTPNLLDFAVVAEKNLVNDVSGSATNNSSIKGSLYGGTDGILVNGGSLSVSGANIAVTDGTISLATGTSFSTDTSVNLWANAFNVISSTLNLSGSTYLSDDLTVNDYQGNASNVSVSGNYYGYGNPVTAIQAATKRLNNTEEKDKLLAEINANPNNYSSSIIVNGTNVSMNFSGIDYLMLSGNAYVGTKLKSTSTLTNGADILTGESVTVKSNQLAYLVPMAYIGKGYTHGGKNPMSADDYNALRTDAGLTSTDNDDKLVDIDSLKTLGASGYEKAFYPSAGSSVVYFYLKFDTAAQASKYFQDYYKVDANKEKLDRYIHFYVNEVKESANTNVKFDLNGTALVKADAKTVTEKSDTLTSGGANSSDTLTERQVNLQDKFAAYRLKLVPTYSALSTDEKKQTVFQNLVKVDDFKSALSGMNYLQFKTELSDLYGVMTEKKVFVKTGNGDPELSGDDLIVYTGDENSSSSTKLRVIITTGDVELDASGFHGLILSNGTVTLKNASAITAAPEDVAKVLEVQLADSSGSNKRMMNYLKDATAYVIGGATSGNVSDSQATSVENLVAFQNWVKQ